MTRTKKSLKGGIILLALPMAVAASLLVFSHLGSCARADASVADEPLTAVSFEKVTLQDDFWLPRLVTQKKTLVPFSLEKTANVVENYGIVGEYLKTGKKQTLIKLPRYVSSDLFKVMEGAACLLTIERDPALEARMDSIIDVIAAAQKPDGYLYELHEVDPSMRTLGFGSGEKPYSFVIHSHELYCMGHMYEAAVAYYRATGKRKWLDVAEKSARHINHVFFEGDPNYNDGKPVNQAPGHEEIELALVKLYNVTEDTLYLNMAKRFLDVRGVTFRPDGEGIMSAEYSQQHLPVREQMKTVGHSVRAMYLYSGMADVLAATGDTTLRPALESVWHDIVDHKMHINGGLGAVAGIEGFGPDYMLPNKDTYDETCAAVGNVLFNHRMFQATKDAKYLDVAEIALYNNVLAGVNLDGNKFFYVNVLESDGETDFNEGMPGRSPWFSCACCPSNLARLIPQVSGMMYSHTSRDIYCGLYASSEVNVPLSTGNVRIVQKTEYPYDGKVTLNVAPEKEGSDFTVWMRVPTWTADRFVPGNLYSYAGNKMSEPSAVSVKVNGEKCDAKGIAGFIPIRRQWKQGDVVELDLPMPVRYSVADERVEADRDRMCVTRGPLVYCAEGADNNFNPSHCIVSDPGAQGELSSIGEAPLQGITGITLNAKVAEDGAPKDASLRLIPYYAWNNRGDNMKMNVWFKTK